jgi:hypothetical protein
MVRVAGATMISLSVSMTLSRVPVTANALVNARGTELHAAP